MFTKYAKPIGILIVICLLFFYKTIISGKLPFPGDLLLAGYAPWDHESYSGYVAGAIPTKDQYFDVIRELYPWKTLVVSEIKKGHIPLWNPYNFSGTPLLANYQSQVFYPFSFLYYMMPQPTAWTVMVVIQPILGSVFLYLFAAEIGLTSAAALLAAILFNFSSFANVWMEFSTIWQTILWLPLLLYLVERGIRQKRLTAFQQLLFIFGLFSAITAGHPQDFINSFLFLLIYTFVRILSARDWPWEGKKSFLANPLLFILSVPFFLASIQLFPTIELFRNSARVAHDYQGVISHMLVQWWQLPLIAITDFFGNPATRSNFSGDFVGKTLSVGVVGFFLALAAIWDKQVTWHKKFFAFAGLTLLLLTVRTPISEFLYRYPWPVLSTGTPTRMLFIFMLSVSVLAGFGYDAVKKSGKLPIKATVTIWIFFAALWGFVLVHPSIEGLSYTATSAVTMKHAMILATAVLLAITTVIIFVQKNKLVLLLLIPLATAELFYSFIKFNPFVPASFVFPQNKLFSELQKISGTYRFWGYGTAEIEANFATQAGLYSSDGTDPLNLAWYNRFIQASRDGNIAVTFNRTTRSDAKIAPGYGKDELPDNKFRLRTMDVLGIKYILSRTENPQDNDTFDTDRFRLISHLEDWVVYENVKAAPKFFVTYDVRPYDDAKDFESQFFGDTFIPGKTVLVEKADWDTLPAFTPLARVNTVKVNEYAPTRIALDVNTDLPGMLFTNDTYDRGWTATVNDAPAQIYKANFAFRGVVVPKGQSTVTFSYRPKSFDTGLSISGLTLGITLLYFIRLFLSRESSQSPKNRRSQKS